MVRERVWIETLTVDGITLCGSLREIMQEGNARRVVINNDEGTTLLKLPLPQDPTAILDNPGLLLLRAWPLKEEPLTLIVERAEQTWQH